MYQLIKEVITYKVHQLKKGTYVGFMYVFMKQKYSKCI